MDTPARKQYLRIKSEHPEEILLFRMGDFYETFDDDARVISKQLDIALTTREMGKGKRIPLAGIPYHALEGYLAKLIKAGNRVAICEQVSEPSASRGLIEREVVRVVTPGTVIEDSLIERGANNYLAAVITSSEIAGLSYVDITTGEFMATEFSTLMFGFKSPLRFQENVPFSIRIPGEELLEFISFLMSPSSSLVCWFSSAMCSSISSSV